MHASPILPILLSFAACTLQAETSAESGPVDRPGSDAGIGGPAVDAETDTASITTSTSGFTDTPGGTGTASDDTHATDTVSTSSDPGDGTPVFDLGAPPDVPPPKTGCTKVDLVFVIDNSGSMSDEQDNLVASFPGFVAGMRTALHEADSYRVGVLTTDEYSHHSSPCTRVLGAFVRETGGAASSATECGPFAEGGRYMSDADPLESMFACVAKVGTSGNGAERPVDALLTALSPALQEPGGCNEGFLRDDALLVAVIISDEDDNASVGPPKEWFAALADVKDGREEHVVVLSLTDREQPNQCASTDLPSTKLLEFTREFRYGYVGDICAPTYDGYFRQAVQVVDIACDDFEPPT